MASGIDDTGDVPGLKSVPTARAAPARRSASTGGACAPSKNEDAGRSTATVPPATPSAATPAALSVVQVIGAPRSQGDGGLRRAARAELIGVDAQREPGARRRCGDGREVVERERDVLHVDVDLVDETFGRRGGDQLVARGADPLGSRRQPSGTAWHASNVTEHV